MEKIRVQAEIDIEAALSSLKTSELEEFSRIISALLLQRKTKNKKAREAELLRQLNECTLQEEHLKEFHLLIEKRDAGALSRKEEKEIAKLIKEEEILRLNRVQVLGQLARLNGISLDDMMEKLGLSTSESV